MPSSPLLLQEHLMAKVQPVEQLGQSAEQSADDIAVQIAEGVVHSLATQVEWPVWGSIESTERQSLESTHSDSDLVKAIPPQLHKGNSEPLIYNVKHDDRGEIYWEKISRY